MQPNPKIRNQVNPFWNVVGTSNLTNCKVSLTKTYLKGTNKYRYLQSYICTYFIPNKSFSFFQKINLHFHNLTENCNGKNFLHQFSEFSNKILSISIIKNWIIIMKMVKPQLTTHTSKRKGYQASCRSICVLINSSKPDLLSWLMSPPKWKNIHMSENVWDISQSKWNW